MANAILIGYSQNRPR